MRYWFSLRLMSVAAAYWYSTLAICGVFGGAMVCLPVTGRMPWRWLLATALYLTVDVDVSALAPRIHGLSWNWTGKAASVLLGLVAMRGFRLSRAEVGLQLPRRTTWPWLGFGFAIILFLTLVGSHGLYRQHIDFETVLFQATMPGLSEEFAYRGVAYALLMRGFGEERPRSSAFAAVLITSCCFGLGHMEPSGVPLPPDFFWMMVRFRAFEFGSHFLFGALFALMRWRSGSVLAPVLAHGLSNVAGTLAAGRV
jgi:membrane protease YdiL (CAAX protease family)